MNEHTESRTIKLGLHSSEPCVDMEIISNYNEQNKRKQDVLLLLGKSGRINAYDDSAIEKHLLQSQTRSPPSLPKEIMVKLPFADSSICIAKFITENQYSFGSGDEVIESYTSVKFVSYSTINLQSCDMYRICGYVGH